MKKLLTTITILIALGSAAAGSQATRKDSLPAGNWSLAFAPAQARGKVVDLFSVMSDAAKGLTVTEVSVENRSSHDVAAVKIGWKLYEKSNPSKTLLSGETPQFLGVALAPGEKRVITFPVVSFARIHGPLLRDGKVEGNFRIELWVSEVQFDNGIAAAENLSSFNMRTAGLKTGAAAKFLKVSSKPFRSRPEDLGCPVRECRWSNQDKCYRCENQEASTCSWTNCNNCASGRCPGLIE